jgi:large conductance mechanosensitive channel
MDSPELPHSQRFKDFVLRGNVIDLSVAVVIGAAFSGVVTAFTDKIIKPLLAAVTPPNTAGFGPQLISTKPSTLVDFGALITSVINFLIVAAVVYFAVVLPMKTLKERRTRGKEPGPAEPADVKLLTEIRDLLKAQTGSDEGSTTRPEPDTHYQQGQTGTADMPVTRATQSVSSATPGPSSS